MDDQSTLHSVAPTVKTIISRRRFLTQTGAATACISPPGFSIASPEAEEARNARNLKCTSDPVSEWNDANRAQPRFREKQFGVSGPQGTIYSLPLVYLGEDRAYALQINAVPSRTKRNDAGAKLLSLVHFTPKIYRMPTRTLIAQRTVLGAASVKIIPKMIHLYIPNMIHLSRAGGFTYMKGAIDHVQGQQLPKGIDSWAISFMLTPKNNTKTKGPMEIKLECSVEVYEHGGSREEKIVGSAAHDCRWIFERKDSEQDVDPNA